MEKDFLNVTQIFADYGEKLNKNLKSVLVVRVNSTGPSAFCLHKNLQGLTGIFYQNFICKFFIKNFGL